MKNYNVLVVASLGVLAMAVAGCANQPTTSNTAGNDPLKSNHSREELDKTGRFNTGPALEAVDPSVQSNGGR